jgi:hypothetical protein
MYGLVPIVIDPEGEWPSERPDLPQLVYASLRDVLADKRFRYCVFVWLDHRGTVVLDEFKHPEDHVVYCIGSDLTGFDEMPEREGPKVRLRNDSEMFANIVVPIVCYDRYLYLQGRRK